MYVRKEIKQIVDDSKLTCDYIGYLLVICWNFTLHNTVHDYELYRQVDSQRKQNNTSQVNTEQKEYKNLYIQYNLGMLQNFNIKTIKRTNYYGDVGSKLGLGNWTQNF